MINNFFTLLNRGVLNEYGRQIERNTYKAVTLAQELHNTIAPVSDDKYSSLCTEQLLQHVLESPYLSRLDQLDPLNTYDRPVMVLSDDTYTLINTSDMVATVLNESISEPRWCAKAFTVSIDVTQQLAKVSSSGTPTTTYNFEMTNNLSDKILLADNIYLRLQGTLPITDFIVSVNYSQKFVRDVIKLVATVSKLKIPWYNADYNVAYQQSLSDLDKVSILTMNLYEILYHGSKN